MVLAGMVHWPKIRFSHILAYFLHKLGFIEGVDCIYYINCRRTCKVRQPDNSVAQTPLSIEKLRFSFANKLPQLSAFGVFSELFTIEAMPYQGRDNHQAQETRQHSYWAPNVSGILIDGG